MEACESGEIVIIVVIWFVVFAQSPGILPVGIPFVFIGCFHRAHAPVNVPLIWITPVGVLGANLIRRTFLIQPHVPLNALGIQHMTHLAAAIDLKDLGTFEQVHLCVL